ncbi:MAG: ATP-binding protein [Chloroflexota bacterium]
MSVAARLDPRTWPIRWQLTALNVGVHAATLIVLSLVFLSQLDGALVGLTAENMRDKVRSISEDRRPPLDDPTRPALELTRPPGAVSRPPGPPPSDAGSDPGRPPGDAGRVPPPFNLQRAAAFAVRRFSGPDSGVLVFDTNGSLIDSTQVYEDQEPWPLPPPELIAQALAGGQRTAIVRQEQRRTLLLAVPLPGQDGSTAGAVVLARSLELIDAVQARLLSFLAVGVAIAVLVGGGLGLRATRGALRPLDRVIHAARAIASGKLDERLRPTKRDEIGELGIAFDTMLDRLAGMVASQRQFVADAAHELRTPLTALGGMVEMLQIGADRGDPTTVRRMLDTMSGEIDRLGRLVADLLTLSRLDAEQPLHPAPVDLAQLIGDVAAQTRLLAAGQQIEVQVERPATVIADPDRMKQVLLNLTANALRFTPAGGRIDLRLRTSGSRAILEVADTGSGIAPELLPRVMDRFVRGDASRARATGGSGLGLAIVSAIVHAHGGSIDIASAPGAGTTVTIGLDLPASAHRSDPHRHPHEPHIDDVAPHAHGADAPTTERARVASVARGRDDSSV